MRTGYPSLVYIHGGRYLLPQAHIWDSAPEGDPSGKGKQLHLGSFLTSTQAAK